MFERKKYFYYMKKTLLLCVVFVVVQFFSFCTSRKTVEDNAWLKKAIDVSIRQLETTAHEIQDTILLPRSIWTGYNVDFCVDRWNGTWRHLKIR